jgi:uncharacterized protein
MRTVLAMSSLRQHFGLTLMVNHACNLRCTYCYTGAKFNAPMPTAVALAAIQRAFASIETSGRLHLSFFGGEPLIESTRILEWMDRARRLAEAKGKHVRFNVTTNGTVTHRDAWRLMMDDDLEIAVSFDGSPEIHDRHRRDPQRRGSAAAAEATLRQLIDSGKPVRINSVVRPDTLDQLPDGLIYLYDLGVRQVDLSLDLWTAWTAGDGRRLEQMIGRAAELWRSWLPDFALNWFDAKAGALAQLPSVHADERCGFGDGEVAVSPSGRLYPCERLIGEDNPDQPFRRPGNIFDADDFLSFSVIPFKRCAACSDCLLNSICDSQCRCSNFIRSGDVNRPDGLLCVLNQATARAVSDAFQWNEPPSSKSNLQNAKTLYG